LFPVTVHMRQILRTVVHFLVCILTRLEVQGIGNVPSNGGAIICGNHLGILDAPLGFALIPRQDATALAAKKHQRNPILRWFINTAGGIWLNQEEADTQAIRAACDHLERGGVLGIAPEGTRSPTGAMIEAKTGVAYLADKAGVPIIPYAVTGTENAVAQWKHLRRPHITVKFGSAFRLPPVKRATREADLRRNTDEIMCRIAAMLPSKYWGIYADHPRLKELQATTR